jgi:hypothetical protein
MKVKIFKKKIEATLLRRNCKEQNYLIFFSNAKNDSFNLNSSTILKSSLKHCFQTSFRIVLYNNFLKFSSFFTNANFNLFITNLKSNFTPIFFIKFKNLYLFNSNLKFVELLNLVANPNFILRLITNLKTLVFFWLSILKFILKIVTF